MTYQAIVFDLSFWTWLLRKLLRDKKHYVYYELVKVDFEEKIFGGGANKCRR